MDKTATMWQCQINNCGYIYNPKKGCRKNKIAAGCSFADLPDDYRCPSCGAGKKAFQPLNAS